jgi:hypothetical protein
MFLMMRIVTSITVVRHVLLRPDSITIEISRKNLTKDTGQVADSRNLSIRDHLAFKAAFIKKGGGNLNDVPLSLATVSRHRRLNPTKSCRDFKSDKRDICQTIFCSHSLGFKAN